MTLFYTFTKQETKEYIFFKELSIHFCGIEKSVLDKALEKCSKKSIERYFLALN